MRAVIGLVLIGGAVGLVGWHWSLRDLRREKGIVPFYLINTGLDERGQFTTYKSQLRAWAAAWPLMLAFLMLCAGTVRCLGG